MANDTQLTIVGNLTDDPSLRFTPSGAAVADFTVATNPRHFDKNTREWIDDPSVFMRCSIWRDAAENVAESLRKGMRVIVQGRLTQRSYETRDGEKRTVLELQADEVGPSLRRARAQVTRNAPRDGATQGPQQANSTTPANHTGAGGYAPQTGSQRTSADDPWHSTGTPAEPPF